MAYSSVDTVVSVDLTLRARRILTMYHTGEDVPHPGYYLLERHEYDTRCQPSSEEKEVLLERGDEFPTCPVCDDPAYWRYLRAKNKK